MAKRKRDLDSMGKGGEEEPCGGPSRNRLMILAFALDPAQGRPSQRVS